MVCLLLIDFKKQFKEYDEIEFTSQLTFQINFEIQITVGWMSEE
jgi:hypothetical protein